MCKMKAPQRDGKPLKYLYSDLPQWRIRVGNLIGVLTGFWFSIGLIHNWLGVPLLLFFIIPFTLMLCFYYVVNYGINVFYPTFSSKKHEVLIQNHWAESKGFPSVDVFITYCGEGCDLVRSTCEGAVRINYPNKQIYILDDKGSSEIEKMAEELGINYISRPNKGHLRKAGNLLYAVSVTKGEYYAVLDADFRPEPDFITDLLPYFDENKTAIVQSPQYFKLSEFGSYSRLLEKGGAETQMDFYRVIQPSRDFFKAAICVGSNVIYKRAYMEAAGGISAVPWCEDIETSYDVSAKGYLLKFVPVILAQGLSPDDPQSYFKQHKRWATSTFKLLFLQKDMNRNVRLSLKICYFANGFYYFSEMIYIMINILIGIYFLTVKQLQIYNFLLFFLPFLTYIFVVRPLFRLSNMKWGVFYASSIQAFSYLYAFITMPFDRKNEWHPTHQKKSKLASDFKGFVVLSLLVCAFEAFIFWVALQRMLFREHWDVLPLIVWMGLLVLIHGFYLFNLLRYSFFNGNNK